MVQISQISSTVLLPLGYTSYVREEPLCSVFKDEIFRALESGRRNSPRRSQHRTPKQGRE